MDQKLLACLLAMFVIPGLVTGIYATSREARFGHTYHALDRASGHPIPIAVKGTGIVYITSTEWATVAPMWHVAYAFIGLAIVVLCVHLCLRAYRSFMTEWHS